jgi:hypothetical protein
MLLISGLLGCKHNQQAVIHQVWTSYDGNVVKIPHLQLQKVSAMNIMKHMMQ